MLQTSAPIAAICVSSKLSHPARNTLAAVLYLWWKMLTAAAGALVICVPSRATGFGSPSRRCASARWLPQVLGNSHRQCPQHAHACQPLQFRLSGRTCGRSAVARATAEPLSLLAALGVSAIVLATTQPQSLSGGGAFGLSAGALATLAETAPPSSLQAGPSRYL